MSDFFLVEICLTLSVPAFDFNDSLDVFNYAVIDSNCLDWFPIGAISNFIFLMAPMTQTTFSIVVWITAWDRS
ncbi:hypothetical protein CIK76_01370 [Glutamicibacter sp. BW80]|nr:hypothetical protein CIK76_01370 [Glutamicibacter sp. BW80]